MPDKTTILEALERLDPKNDDHWTAAGLPSMLIVRSLSGNPEVTRAQIEAVAPGMNRETKRSGASAPVPEPPQESPADAPQGTPSPAPESEPDTQPGKPKPQPAPEVDEPTQYTTARVAEIDRALEAEHAELQRERQTVERAVAAVKRREQRIDGLEAEKVALAPRRDQDRERALYLQRSQENRERRAEERRAFVASVPRQSKLDAALGNRGRGFGLKRPQYPQIESK